MSEDNLSNDASTFEPEPKPKPKPKSEPEPKPEPKSKYDDPIWKNVQSSVKSLGNTDQDACRDNVKDVVMFGDDLFKLLSKASSANEGWMKSTKAMEVGRGCVVQVTTQQRNPDGSYTVAEAVTFVPGVRVVETKDTEGVVTGRRLK